MPIRVIITHGTTADCTQAAQLIEGIDAQALFADKAYDTDEIVNKAMFNNMQIVIPPKRNRRKQRYFNKQLYKLRHLVENAFLKIKQWRGIATRYAKNASSFLAAIQIRCMVMWLNILLRHSVVELCCEIDDFCKLTLNDLNHQLIGENVKVTLHTRGLSVPEVLTILIYYYFSKFTCLKHYSLIKVH